MIMSASRKQKPGKEGVQSGEERWALGRMTWPAWGLGMGAPSASPSGVLESEVQVLGESLEVTVGFPGRTGDWEVSGAGNPLEGVVPTLSPLCWLPARNEKGKASHPKK